MNREGLSAQIMAAIEDAQRRAREGREPVVAIVVVPVESATEAELRPEDDDLEFDRPWKGRFIEWLRKGRPISLAAELAGVSKRHAHRCRHTDLKFGRAWNHVERFRARRPGRGRRRLSKILENVPE